MSSMETKIQQQQQQKEMRQTFKCQPTHTVTQWQSQTQVKN